MFLLSTYISHILSKINDFNNSKLIKCELNPLKQFTFSTI